MIILGSVLVEIIGRSHLKKSDWLVCLFHLIPSLTVRLPLGSVLLHAFLKN